MVGDEEFKSLCALKDRLRSERADMIAEVKGAAILLARGKMEMKVAREQLDKLAQLESELEAIDVVMMSIVG
jgi:hypothetical protein